MSISQAGQDDLAAIIALEQASFAPEEQWSAQSWVDELAAPDRAVLVRMGPSGNLIGVATFSAVADTADLLRIIVAAEARGKGVAVSLVRAGLDWAAARGAKQMLLEVNPDNAAAVGLYHRFGFTKISRRADYYGSGRDALVMVLAIESSDNWAVSA